jgi:hypothetical protein
VFKNWIRENNATLTSKIDDPVIGFYSALSVVQGMVVLWCYHVIMVPTNNVRAKCRISMKAGVITA